MGRRRFARAGIARYGVTRVWWLFFVCGAACTIMLMAPSQNDGGPQSRDRASKPEIADTQERLPAGSGGGADEGGAREGADGSLTGYEDRTSAGEPYIRVYLSANNRIETVPIEWYVRGVVAGEMPADFELEALKAQAIAARTYIVRKLRTEAGGQGGKPAAGADVSDTMDDQVYIPLKKLLHQWGEASGSKLKKIERAVAETKGRIILYEGEPIQAAFFSTSNGYTENSEDYWEQSLPYLRSVPSPWEAGLSPRYKETITMKTSDFYRKLGLADGKGSAISVVSWTEGRRIKELAVGEERISGREARERLGLRSSQFTWSVSGDKIAITTFGYGHGVGMSQWGANALAKQGRKAEEILKYYYSGVRIAEDTNL